jgi:hypothetical protein
MHSFPSIFLWFIYQNYEIIHADTCDAIKKTTSTLLNLGCSFIKYLNLPKICLELIYFMHDITDLEIFIPRFSELNG